MNEGEDDDNVSTIKQRRNNKNVVKTENVNVFLFRYLVTLSSFYCFDIIETKWESKMDLKWFPRTYHLVLEFWTLSNHLLKGCTHKKDIEKGR